MEVDERTLTEHRYDFGTIPKRVASSMWRCNILTGELVLMVLSKELVRAGNKKYIKGIPPLVNRYWIMTKPNYFYMPAKDIFDAKEKFEAEFARADEHFNKLNKTEEKTCLKKV